MRLLGGDPGASHGDFGSFPRRAAWMECQNDRSLFRCEKFRNPLSSFSKNVKCEKGLRLFIV